MATEITVRTGPWVTEDRSWTIGHHMTTTNAPLDFSLFTGANFADGMIKSGCVLGRVTATGKHGPYEAGASDGRQTSVGHLVNTSKIPADVTVVATDAILAHGQVRQGRLPYESGLGALDDAAKADLPGVEYI